MANEGPTATSSPEMHHKLRNSSDWQQRAVEWDLIEAYKRTVNHLPHQLQLFPSQEKGLR